MSVAERLPEDVRSALEDGIKGARVMATKVGALHGAWDTILDAEALLNGEPTLSPGTPGQVAEECLKEFRRYRV